MNFTEYALKNKAFVYFFVFVLVVGGIYSFFTMSKLEDPAITVKQAMVVTAYPGASAYQVELDKDGQVIVEADLSSGTRIVAAGVNGLKEGQKVRLLPPVSSSNVGKLL